MTTPLRLLGCEKCCRRKTPSCGFTPEASGGAAGGVLAFALLWASPGQAQSETTAFGMGTAAITYTDNLYNAPFNAAPDLPQRESAWYVVLAPGAGISHDRWRSGYVLTYGHSFIQYLTTSQADAHADHLAGAADYELSPLDTLSFTLAGTRSSTAIMLADPAAMGRPQPYSSATFYTATSSQELVHAFSPEWSGIERVSFGVSKAAGSDLPEPWRYTASCMLGADYGLPRDVWSFNWQGTYFHSRAAERDGARLPRTRYFQTGPSVAWRHDINEEWASQVNAGIGVAYQPEEDPRFSLAPPSFGAALSWEYDVYAATLTYSATTDPDLVTNRVYYRDAASLSASWLILPRQRVSLTTTNAVSANRALVSPALVPGADEGTVFAWTSTAVLSWSPEGLPQFALAYLHSAQLVRGGSEAAALPGFERNQVTLSVGWHYPEVNLSRLARRSSFRVSPSETSPEGLEPSERKGNEGEGD